MWGGLIGLLYKLRVAGAALSSGHRDGLLPPEQSHQRPDPVRLRTRRGGPVRLQACPRRTRCDSRHLTRPYFLSARPPDGRRGTQCGVKSASEKRRSDSSRQTGNYSGACSGMQPRGVSRAARETTPQA